jgi:hypothetical protein
MIQKALDLRMKKKGMFEADWWLVGTGEGKGT